MVLIGIASLALRSERPRTVGFRRPASWSRAVLIALVTGIALQLLSTYVTEPFVTHLTHQRENLSEFA